MARGRRLFIEGKEPLDLERAEDLIEMKARERTERETQAR